MKNDHIKHAQRGEAIIETSFQNKSRLAIILASAESKPTMTSHHTRLIRMISQGNFVKFKTLLSGKCVRISLPNNIWWFVRFARWLVPFLLLSLTLSKSYPNFWISAVHYKKVDQKTFCGECMEEGPSPLPLGATDYVIKHGLGWRKLFHK